MQESEREERERVKRRDPRGVKTTVDDGGGGDVPLDDGTPDDAER
jgi:hypothetical protein